jgi:hypothetical protein
MDQILMEQTPTNMMDLISQMLALAMLMAVIKTYNCWAELDLDVLLT